MPVISARFVRVAKIALAQVLSSAGLARALVIIPMHTNVNFRPAQETLEARRVRTRSRVLLLPPLRWAVYSRILNWGGTIARRWWKKPASWRNGGRVDQGEDARFKHGVFWMMRPPPKRSDPDLTVGRGNIMTSTRTRAGTRNIDCSGTKFRQLG
jgi:hypothetical protein